jgi:hypothetical protein
MQLTVRGGRPLAIGSRDERASHVEMNSMTGELGALDEGVSGA